MDTKNKRNLTTVWIVSYMGKSTQYTYRGFKGH